MIFADLVHKKGQIHAPNSNFWIFGAFLYQKSCTKFGILKKWCIEDRAVTGIAALILYKKEIDMIVNPPRDALTSRYDFVRKMIDYCVRQMDGLPDGRIKISHRGNIDYYYHVTGEGKDNLVDKEVAHKIAQRSYYEKFLKAARAEERMLEQMMDRYSHPMAEDIYKSLSIERQDLINPVIMTDQQYIDKWLAQEYEHKGFKEGASYYETLKGERVRSKSEQIIADRLAAKNVPYLYERPLKLGSVVLHPDFTVLRVRDRKEMILEHLGKLGDMDYASDAVRRINIYHQSGIVQGNRLFLLGETGDCPFDVRTLDVLIEEMFL